MFANTFQSGFLSIFYSVGSNPLQLWDKQVKNGHIRRVVDDEVRSLVLEISGTNVATTYITCPIKPRLSLGIKLPFLVMIIKNMKKYFTFEIQILDDKDMHRRFRVSNFQSTTKVRPFCTTMPIGLSSGWNQVQFNLADFTKRAYGSTYLETTRVQIHANVRIRRIYFSDVLYSDEELPNEYKLFVPTPGTQIAQKPGKPAEKKESKEKRDSKTEGQVAPPAEMEPPSGAPPSPVGPEDNPPSTPAASSEAPTEMVIEPSSTDQEGEATTTVEPTSEDVTTTEPTTTELTEQPTEAPPEAPQEGEATAEAGDTFVDAEAGKVEAPEAGEAEAAPPAEAVEAPEAAAAAPPQEEAPAGEPSTEESPEYIPPEKLDEIPADVPHEAPPPPPEEPQEPPAEEGAQEDAPAEEPPAEQAEAAAEEAA